jgi:hypothetical protein
MPLWVPPTQIGISTQGNTGGTTGFASATNQLVGTNLITLSQSTGVGGNTVTIVGPRVPGMTRYNNIDAGGTVNPYASLGTINGSMQLFPMVAGDDVFPGNMSALTLFIDMSASHTNTTATTQAQTLRYSVGIYTLSGLSSLSLLNSAGGSVTAAAAANQSSLWHGPRYLTLVSSQFSASLTFSQTSYWMGIILSSSGTTNSNFSYLGYYRAATGTNRSGIVGVAGASAANSGWEPWAGIVATAGLPASLHLTNVTKTGVSGGFIPHIVMEALHSTW